MTPGTTPAPYAVLWDLDGTLVDSNQLHWLAWRETMAARGHSLTFEQFTASYGQRNDAILRGWLGAALSAAESSAISDAKEVIYRRMVRTRGLELLPGAEAWLQRLHAASWRQALATSAPAANVDTILEVLGIGSFFGAIITAEDVTHGKPDPSVFLLAARRVAAPIYRCVVVEDSPAGIEGARRAGMRCIGVGPRHASLAADLAAPNLAALPEDAFDWVLAVDDARL